MFPVTSKLPNVRTTVFSVMSKLATEYNAINLSQGFPDFDCSPELINLANQYMLKGNNQYAPMQGILPLREKIAAKVFDLHGANYHPENEITITAGGTQAIYTAIAAMVQPDDEVIIFEPAYDSYAPTIQLQGGLVKSLELCPPDYKINWEVVRKLITNRTRMIILNSPQNPTGTILDENDIKQLIKLITNTDILILSDEVYEHLVFDKKQHLSMARYPELKNRSFITASFGKLFHNTGWKVGYCIAPEKLMTEFRKIHQFLVFSVNTPIQYAISDFLDNKSYYMELSNFYQEKRDHFKNLLKSTRFDILPCEGSYFQSVQYHKITSEGDHDFAIRLIKEFGVAGIPTSAFYKNGADYKVLRFCFAKKQETLDKAVERLIKV
ncbi:MAG: aminotransferase [Sphingobacteriales bacterium]|nr:aminotransferase [Sphingobacteriales bacterium]